MFAGLALIVACGDSKPAATGRGTGTTSSPETNNDTSSTGVATLSLSTTTSEGGSAGTDTGVDCSAFEFEAPLLDRAAIELSPGLDAYQVQLGWSGGLPSEGQVVAEVGPTPQGPWTRASEALSVAEAGGAAHVDKLLPDLYVRLRIEVGGGCGEAGPPVHLAKPDYRDPDEWSEGWIRVVSHTHTISDIKEDGGSIHANRINWFNGCFEELGDENACHQLLLQSFSEAGVQWLIDAAAGNAIDSVIVTDHDNVGIWFTDIFRQYNVGNPSGPSVVAGLEWTSGVGHLTVVGNFLPEVDRAANIFDLQTGVQVHTNTPLPPDVCDDSDENHDINHPIFDGPDAPCTRADGRGHGDDLISVDQAREAINALHERGALVFVNHPTNDTAGLEPPMAWNLDNLDIVDGVEVNTPDPTLTNRNAPEWWRDNGLRRGRPWVGIAGTDCHVSRTEYDGSTGCNSIYGVDVTHLDAPYMWIRSLRSTSHAAINAPDLVVAGLREGRVTVVQDTDPAVVVDLGIDVNADGMLDYWSGSTIPACEQPNLDQFTVQVMVRPVQTHNYNVNVWTRSDEEKILDREEIGAGQIWRGSFEFSRSTDIEPDVPLGFASAWVREDITLNTDNDAGFSNAIFFEAPDPDSIPCSTRNIDGL